MRTYTGSCMCGGVRFEADLDLEAGTSRCNCSLCAKQRAWNVMTAPGGFRLVSGADELSDYPSPNSGTHGFFCRRCGIRIYHHGHVEELGGEFHAVNVAALDDAEPDLARAPILYRDGRGGTWAEVPEIKHL